MTYERSNEYWTTAAVTAVAFFIYRITMAPTVGYIDSGELAAVASTLGNAHSTGYPLYTILGRFFSMLPVAETVILRLNILSAVLTAAAAGVFFLLVIELMREKGRTVHPAQAIAAAVSSLLLAFSRTFWLQGVSAEVYALHLLLITLVLLWFVKAVRTGEARWWFLFAFCVGLSFTNHMTTILLAPALLYWFFAEHGWSKAAFRRIGQLSLPFIAGLSVYLYLPLRASSHPPFNWGDPQTIESFWRHVTGKQFRVWMFSGSDVIRKQFDHFTSNLPLEFHPAVLLIAVIGAAVLLVRSRRLFVVSLILFVTCIAYSVNYDIHDIDTYFLLAFLVIALWSAFGIAFLLDRFEGRTARAVMVAAVIALIPLQTASRWEAADQSRNTMAAEYTRSILASLPPNAVVISAQWDYFVSPSYYFQHIEKVRPDVIVLDKELFRRSWYFPQLQTSYPELMQRSQQEVAAFLPELHKFEQDLPYDPAVIEGRYAALLRSFLPGVPETPVYVTPEIEPQYLPGYLRIPEGFLFRLTRDTLYRPVEMPDTEVQPYGGTDKYSAGLRSIMANAHLYRAAYERYYGKDSLAQIFTQKASKFTAFPPSSVSNF
ncbi:MAG: DUF2723 domain-containing protein [Bacteroidetes bacterium]|nr:DUF2723 domain-containing protein [Bacteroidota bacterium]